MHADTVWVAAVHDTIVKIQYALEPFPRNGWEMVGVIVIVALCIAGLVSIAYKMVN